MKTRSKSHEEELAKQRERKASLAKPKREIGEEREGIEASMEKTNLTVEMLSTRPNPKQLSHSCVYCGTPCATLYKQLTKSLSSIKVMHCNNCKRIADPYIEREWLLIVIDCILLRPEAYRHILYNNREWSYNTVNQEGKTTRKYDSIHRLIKWTVISSLLHAYLKFQSLARDEPQIRNYDNDDHDDSFMVLLAAFTITSILDFAAQWLATYGYMKFVAMMSSMPSLSSAHSIAYQIYVALLLPTSFRVISVLVLIWENSKTTMALGSLLVAYWQFLGLSLISNEPQNGRSILASLTPIVGVASLIAWRLAIDCLFQALSENSVYNEFSPLHKRIPCVGFELGLSDDGITSGNEKFLCLS